MNKKKIIFRVVSFPTKSETFVTYQIILAIKLGYDIRILVNEKNPIESSSQPDLIEQYSLLEKTVELKRIMPKGYVTRIFKIVLLLFRGASFSYLKTFNYFKYGKQGLIGNIFFRLYEFKNHFGADLFHIQFGTMKYPLDSLKRYGFIKGKLLTTFHGYDIYEKTNLNKNVKHDYRDLFSVGELFTCNTKYLAQQLTELNCPPEKMRIIPMATDTDYFVPTVDVNKERKIRLLTVGRLIKLKGHEYGIKAVAELVKKGHDLKYHIIGEGEEWEYLQSLIEKLELSNHVFLKGAKTQEKILGALQRSDIYLMPSTYDEAGRRETQGVVTGEAQACGLPVVAFRSGGVPYTIAEGETGFLSEENDYLNMADNIERLINNEKLRKKMGNNAREFVENNYSQHHLNTVWESVYDGLLN